MGPVDCALSEVRTYWNSDLMANSERSFQTELLIAMRRQGFHAFKITTPFMVGVPDLYVKAWLRPPVWIELKYIKSPTGKVELTPLQRKFMRDEHKVGGRAGWAVCTGNDLYAGNNTEIVSIGPLHWLQHRAPGEEWNVQALLERIINDPMVS